MDFNVANKITNGPTRFFGAGNDATGEIGDPQRQAILDKNRDVATYQDSEGFATKASKAILAAPLDLADSIVSSLSLGGVERGDLNDSVLRGIGWDSAADWVKQNQGAVEVASGIGGIIGTAFIGGLAVPRLLESAYVATTALGRGYRGVQALTINAQRASRAGELAAARNGEFLRLLAPANRAYLGTRVGKAVGIAALEETLLATTMHTNSFIWDQEDMSNNLLYAGLGLGIAGGVSSIGARYSIRAWANSPVVRDVRENALDPGMYSRIRQYIGAPAPVNANDVPKMSSILTAQMLESRYDINVGQGATSPVLRSKREALQTQAEGQAFETLQKITQKGDSSIPASRFSVDKTPEGQHLKEALYDDPATLYGLDSISRISPDVPHMSDLLQRRQDRIDGLLQSQDPTDVALGKRLDKQQPLVLVNRDWVEPEVGGILADYKPEVIKKSSPNTREREFESVIKGRRVYVDEFGRLATQVAQGGRNAVKSVANWESMPLHDQLNAFRAMRETIDYRVRHASVFILPKSPTWLQMDYALELARRGGQVDLVSQSPFKTLHDVQVASLQKKGAVLGNRSAITDLDRIRYNLPLATSFERVVDPNGDSLKAIFIAAQRAGVTSDDLIQARRTGQQLLELSENQRTKDRLDGDIFNFQYSSRAGHEGEYLRPVLGFFSDNAAPQWSKFSLAESVAEVKAFRFHELTGPNAGRMTTQLTQETYASPLLRDAQNIAGLADNQVTGTGNRVSETMRTMVTAEMAARDNKSILAAQRLRHLINQQADHYLGETLKREMGDVVNRVNSAANTPSRQLVNQFLSNRAGWELEDTPILTTNRNGGDFWVFPLKQDSEQNARLLGHAVGPDDYMLNLRTGEPIALDDLGLEFMNRFNNMTSSYLMDKNALRRAMGIRELHHQNWYTPPPNTRGKYFGFTFDANNDVVFGGGIVADTAEEFQRLVRAHEAQLPPGQRFISHENVEAFGDLWDRAGMDWIDPGANMTRSAHNRGTLSSSTVNQRAVEDAMEWIRRTNQSVADDTVRVIFDGPLSVVNARKAVAEKGGNPLSRSIWDHYEEALMGRMAGRSEKSPTGRLATKLDETIDGALAAAWPYARGGWRHVRDLFQRVGFRGNPTGRNFQELTDELAEFMPYRDAMDYAEQTHKLSPPPEIRKIADKLNKFSAAMLLRWLEFPMAAMNMIGVVTNLPSILQASGVRTLPRISRQGSNLQFLDTYKIMAQGFKDMLSRKSHQDWQYMKRNGDTTQSVLELNTTMGLVDSRSAFGRILLGDPRAPLNAKGEKTVKGMGIDGVISLATDTTEEWSRTWAHFVGLRLADASGIIGREARHNFAREIANQTIANYNPLNRPELFHSAFGSLYGLFASYMMQYNMRLFRWMETGQFAALGRQMATQASMFGLGSVPGFGAIQALAGGAVSGDPSTGDTPIDHIYERFGPAAGSAVAHGGIAAIAQLFGASYNAGPALYTRGDANLRGPSMNMSQMFAGFGVVKSVAEGIMDMAEHTLSDNTVGSQQRIAEILARNMPNRAIKGAITVLMAGGKDVDKSGQVMAETRSGLESAYRILGTRSVRQQGEIEAYYLNNKAMDMDAARLAKLRLSTRALIRQGDYDRLPEIFTKYLDSGGKPWNFQQWIKSQVQESQDSRGQRQLLKAMRTPGYEALARRIEMMTGVNAYESLPATRSGVNPNQ